MTETYLGFQLAAGERVNTLLEQRLSAIDAPMELREAMLYSVMNGGKRLRPSMSYAAFALIDGLSIEELRDPQSRYQAVDNSAVALEMMHSYSLVHDDLPAMDDDDLRRGKPSCHIAFGEAMAILAGDALQALAFEQLCDSKAPAARLVRLLAYAAGPVGMVGGQVLDIQTTDTDITQNQNLEALETVHRRKTGALITASLLMGGVCAEASSAQNKRLQSFGELCGLAFQVVDDILDVTASTDQLGKRQGSDNLLGKRTYPDFLGLEGAQSYARDLCEQAKLALHKIDGDTHILAGLADYISQRGH